MKQESLKESLEDFLCPLKIYAGISRAYREHKIPYDKEALGKLINDLYIPFREEVFYMCKKDVRLAWGIDRLESKFDDFKYIEEYEYDVK